MLLDDIGKALAAAHSSRAEKADIRKSRATWYRLTGACRTTSWLWRYGIYGLWSIAVIYQLVFHSWKHLTMDLFLLGMNLFTGGVLLLALRTSPSIYARVSAYVVLLCAIPAAAWSCHGLAVRWHREFACHYDALYRCDAFTALARLDLRNERICVCDYRYYPFLGSRRQFNVCRPLWLPDYSHLLQYLQDRKVTLLVVRFKDVNPQRRYAGVREWITARPQLFQPVYENRNYTIVRVDAAELTAETVPVVIRRSSGDS